MIFWMFMTPRGNTLWQPFLPDTGARAPRRAASADGAAWAGERLLNRDLSWLNFNDRVLAEAADPSVPCLERLRFATIVSSNLDEFFMVRVAGIARLAQRAPGRRTPDGLPAGQLVALIREHVLRQKSRQAGVLDDILRTLARHGIRIHSGFPGRWGPLDREIRRRLPAVRYVLRRAAEALPPLQSEIIQVFVRFPGEYAILSIPDRGARLIELPARGGARRFALAERWLSARAPLLFPDREVIEAFPFKIIRDADLRYRPDDEETLEEQIVEAVRRRSEARVVRLEVDAPAYSEGALFLATALGLGSAGLYRFDLPLDLRTLARLHRLQAASGLRYPPVRPHVPPPLRHGRSVFDRIRERDILLHHPYDSFEVVERFVREAARDPQVTQIFHTMYRTSRDAPTLDALREAARRGKQVTAYIEIKARFDELNNVRCAEALRRAGVRVVRPIGGYKVHTKITQVFRREGAAEVSYLHLGTGNYHPATARQYTDLGLLTADGDLGRDVTLFRHAMERRQRPAGMTDLLAAPGPLHERILALIREEARIQRMGGRGRIIAKMNALVDPDTVDALYAASAAGVRIDLLVRGICCLKPGLRGLSETIRVVSIVDRYLEHSRIYYFRAGGADRVYLSSADWMPRNFFTRYELAFPVKDEGHKRHLLDVVLGAGLADNVKAWQLRPDGSYVRVARHPAARPIRSQFMLEAMARKR
jgi:polyphosphate kinase